MPPPQPTLVCNSPEATARAARALAARLRAGDTVLLSGDVGAGKSHFARAAILSLLDAPEDVPSPTYTLVQTYRGRDCEIWHADLYRLGDASELAELGLEVAFDAAIVFVEWPDRLGALAPARALGIGFSASGTEETRVLNVTWNDATWRDRLSGLWDD